MIVLIDNYDSFSYNLYQMIGTHTPEIKVIRNDAHTIASLKALHPAALILSPGPGRPEAAGICSEAVQYFHKHIPIFGVCLGHQVICEVFGATVTYAKKLMHGKPSTTTLDPTSALFKNCPGTTQTAHYHSLSVLEETLPDPLQVIARADDGKVLAVQHATHPVFGVQFHPESFMTENGDTMIQNFLHIAHTFQPTEVTP